MIALNLRDLWEYRELIYFLTWRDLKVRYKQTILGFAWVMLQPIINMVVFTVLFGQLLNVPTGGIPYPIFSFAALLPWGYFAGSLTRSSTTLVGSANLISKVYFPRMVIPISGVISGFVDFAVAFIVLLGMMIFYKIVPPGIFYFCHSFCSGDAHCFRFWTLAFGIKCSFRDINHLVPF